MPRLHLHSAIDEIPAPTWDALAGDQPSLSHAYLSALETSGCVSSHTGWTPRHAALWEGDTLLAVMPLYLKTHSYGEYVFDWPGPTPIGAMGWTTTPSGWRPCPSPRSRGGVFQGATRPAGAC